MFARVSVLLYSTQMFPLQVVISIHRASSGTSGCASHAQVALPLPSFPSTLMSPLLSLFPSLSFPLLFLPLLFLSSPFPPLRSPSPLCPTSLILVTLISLLIVFHDGGVQETQTTGETQVLEGDEGSRNSRSVHYGVTCNTYHTRCNIVPHVTSKMYVVPFVYGELVP